MHQRLNATDKKRRIVIIIVFTLMVGAGAVLIGMGLPWLEDSSQRLDSERAVNYIVVTIMFTLLSVVPLGIFILWLGIKTYRYARVPPSLARFQRAGRVVSRRGQRYAFAVIVNGRDTFAARQIQDRVAALLAAGVEDRLAGAAAGR